LLAIGERTVSVKSQAKGARSARRVTGAARAPVAAAHPSQTWAAMTTTTIEVPRRRRSSFRAAPVVACGPLS
jgi:hypothetical protein